MSRNRTTPRRIEINDLPPLDADSAYGRRKPLSTGDATATIYAIWS